ncbi:MAG TPA: hypothetical protein PK802_00565 [Candidatus Cloacimonadota bacterium]|jgi:hypothetical protein|nr:hypothetical protein [Candidatus Cloacimonadota bacterium]HOF59088.1 hypothetical protein [Candidatus Cloacimonadota bacterium]HOR58112.1 hypothetical protein [Candidatus Cloacimonadota bacterium]HPB08168.1 hypothetical protein [Candidatus Cloacimonadota bacterium]HPL22829.1 hypothetical protein [Candidatus Cloacimonadota bacterium]
MNETRSLLSEQNFWLRIVILILSLMGALEASLKQILGLTVLFLLFLLLDLECYAKILKALRISLPFLAGYWVFATLFGTGFLEMLLFTAKIVFFIVVTVYVFGNLSLRRVLHDTRCLRKTGWGSRLVHFSLATALFLRAYLHRFAASGIRSADNIGNVFDRLVAVGKEVAGNSDVIEAQIRKIHSGSGDIAQVSGSNLIALCLLCCMILILSL